MKNIEIYGAGLAGLTAAINLAREGYSVTVHEKEKRIGGSPKCHPSIHMTPIHFQKMQEYIGIDVEPCFSELELFKAYIYSNIVTFNTRHLYVAERGPRETSLDYYLYKIASDEGVNFHFSHPLTPEMLSTLPENSIIAAGTYSLLCKHLNIPHTSFKHLDSHIRTKDIDNVCLAYFDSYMAGYGYISAKNGLLSAQVSLAIGSPRTNLEKFEKRVKDTEDINFTRWSSVNDHFPEKIQLFTRVSGKTFVLAGDISGFFDPFFCFGVNGAMVSGKIAAMAILSKERALREFRRFMVKLNRMFLMNKFYSSLPLKKIFVPGLFKNFNKRLPIFGRGLRNIPGFTHEDCFKIISIQDQP